MAQPINLGIEIIHMREDDASSQSKKKYELNKYSPLSVFLALRSERNKAIFSATVESLMVVALATTCVALLAISFTGVAAPATLPLAIGCGVMAVAVFTSFVMSIRKLLVYRKTMRFFDQFPEFKKGLEIYDSMDKEAKKAIANRGSQLHIAALLDKEDLLDTLKPKPPQPPSSSGAELEMTM